jgi:hypothetical protein
MVSLPVALWIVAAFSALRRLFRFDAVPQRNHSAAAIQHGKVAVGCCDHQANFQEIALRRGLPSLPLDGAGGFEVTL